MGTPIAYADGVWILMTDDCTVVLVMAGKKIVPTFFSEERAATAATRLAETCEPSVPHRFELPEFLAWLDQWQDVVLFVGIDCVPGEPGRCISREKFRERLAACPA
jgi:hypothetical protein